MYIYIVSIESTLGFVNGSSIKLPLINRIIKIGSMCATVGVSINEYSSSFMKLSDLIILPFRYVFHVCLLVVIVFHSDAINKRSCIEPILNNVC